jgi:hypothetical protein
MTTMLVQLTNVMKILVSVYIMTLIVTMMMLVQLIAAVLNLDVLMKLYPAQTNLVILPIVIWLTDVNGPLLSVMILIFVQ